MLLGGVSLVNAKVASGGQEPHVNRNLTGRLGDTIDAHEAAWQACFADQGLRPYEITYEDLAEDPIGVTSFRTADTAP